MYSGKEYFFIKKKVTPNLFKGSITLLKSLLERLLSPINLILYGDLINKPAIKLAKVPELPAFSFKFFLNLYPSNP